MRSFGRWLLPFLVLVVFASFVFYYRGVAGAVFSARFLGKSFFSRSFDYQRIEYLEVRNQFLEGEILRLESVRSGGGEGGVNYREVGVYSNYPFGDKSLIAIDFGVDDGASLGMPVLASEGVVLGKIVTVKNTQSVVQTIFDGGWASSVVVGSEGAKGVLRGGSSPKLELVSRDSDIREGDTAFSASDDLPLGKLVGVVEKVERGQGNFWSDVSVRSLFNFEELRTVLVVTDFP